MTAFLTTAGQILLAWLAVSVVATAGWVAVRRHVARRPGCVRCGTVTTRHATLCRFCGTALPTFDLPARDEGSVTGRHQLTHEEESR